MAVLPGRTRTEHSTLARAPAEPLLVRTTRWVLRRRHAVIAVWLAALLAGGLASLHLRPLLANGFGVPHTDSQIAGRILRAARAVADGGLRTLELVASRADRPARPRRGFAPRTRTWSLLLPSLTRRSGRCRTRPRLASSVYFDRKAGPMALTRPTTRSPRTARSSTPAVNKTAPAAPIAEAASWPPSSGAAEATRRQATRCRTRRAGATTRSRTGPALHSHPRRDGDACSPG
jgi:hypothetical protein